MENIYDVIEYVTTKVEKLSGSLSNYEKDIIKSSLTVAQKEVPTSKLLIADNIQTLLKNKSDINYLIYRLKDLRNIKYRSVSSEYNKLYTILTRQGRPSRQAIDSEIKYNHPDIASVLDNVNDFDLIIEFFNNLLNVIDLVVKNYEQRRYEI